LICFLLNLFFVKVYMRNLQMHSVMLFRVWKLGMVLVKGWHR